MERLITCPVSFLTDVTIAIERHIVARGEPRKWISYASLADMVNLYWRGTSVTFTADDAEKAVRELQAIDVLELSGRDTQGIFVVGQPIRPERDETYHPRFHGSMGSYDNPTPIRVLKRVFTALPLPARSFNPADVANSLVYHPATVVKAMRELRLMNDYNYKWQSPGYVQAIKKKRELSYAAYQHTLGADPYA